MLQLIFMRIYIYDIQNNDTIELDRLILDLKHKFKDKIEIRKFNLDEKSPEDVIKFFKENGIKSLPIIKTNDKISTQNDLKNLLQSTL